MTADAVGRQDSERRRRWKEGKELATGTSWYDLSNMHADIGSDSS